MKKAFSLIELMVAILLGSILLLVIAGSLQSTIRTWEAVQQRVSQNYNRRSVLDLIRRQTSSLFYRKDADALDQAAPGGRIRNRPSTPTQPRPEGQSAREPGDLRSPGGDTPGRPTGFMLPQGAYFLKGNNQEINFLSTVSFLSDFPGQVAVRYYVVQGSPEEGESLFDLPSSRSGGGGGDDDLYDPDVPMDALDGDLYLYMEEKNLFLSMVNNTEDEGLLDDIDPTPPTGPDPTMMGERPLIPNQEDEMGGEVAATYSMKLIGPLRSFSIRYRLPRARRAGDMETDGDWAEAWDVDVEGMYPSAVEFVLYYETPGETDDIDTEDLPAVRMVLPVYDSSNLVRGGINGPGF